jgi:hypothetical protein
MCESNVTLAEYPGLGRVRLCSCGCAQLSLGPITIRLEPAALGQAANMLQSAFEKQQSLQRQNNTDALPPDWSSAGKLVH